MNRRSFLKTFSAFGAAITAMPVVNGSTPPRGQNPVDGATRASILTVAGYGPWKVIHHLNATGLRVRGSRISRRGHSEASCVFRVVPSGPMEAILHLVRPERPGFLARFLDAPTFAVTIYARVPVDSLWGEECDRMLSEWGRLVARAPAPPGALHLPPP